MKYIQLKYCNEEGCKKRGVYSYEKDTARFCSKHKLDDMIDFKHIICKVIGCKKRALYNYPGKSAISCSLHKLDKMVNLDRYKRITKKTSVKKTSVKNISMKKIILENIAKEDIPIDRSFSPDSTLIFENDNSIEESFNIMEKFIEEIVDCYIKTPNKLIDALDSKEGKELITQLNEIQKI